MENGQDSFQPTPAQAQDSFIPIGNTSSIPASISSGPAAGRGSNVFTAGPSNGGLASSGGVDKLIDFIRPFIGGAVGKTAGALAAPAVAVPGIGPAIPIAAETQAYAGVDSLMQTLKPGNWKEGKFQPTAGEVIGEAEKDALINSVGVRVLNGVFRGANALFGKGPAPDIYKFLPTSSQALENYGYHKLATAAEFMEDFGAANAKSAALDKSGGAGFTQALRFANSLNNRQAVTNSDPVKLADKIKATLESALQPVQQGQTYKSWSKSFIASQKSPSSITQEAYDLLQGGSSPFAKLDAVITDPDKLSKVLVAGQQMGQAGLNVRKDLQSYQFMRMINDSATRSEGNVVRLDYKKIEKVWDNPELKTSLDALYGSQGRKNVTDFLKNLKMVDDNQSSYLGKRAIYYASGGFGINGMANLLMGNPQVAATSMGTAAMFIPAHLMAKALTKPEVARSLVAMAGGEGLSESKQFVARQLFNAIQGGTMALTDTNGKQIWGSIEKDPNTSGGYRFKQQE